MKNTDKTDASRKKIASVRPGPQKDAIALLKADHAEARELLSTLAESTERAVSKRRTILAKVAPAVWVHMQIEEEIFYPAFEAAQKTADDEVKSIEARAEHDAGKAALGRLQRCDPASTEFRAMAKVVHDLIDHHASEEEDEMFPRVRKLIGKDELLALGGLMASRKAELLASGRFDRVPSAPKRDASFGMPAPS